MNGLDVYVLETLHALRDLTLVQVFIRITELGSVITVCGITLSLALYLWLRGRFAFLGGLLVTVAGASGTIFVLKELIARARPDSMYQAYVETGFSFPSGHAALALALYGYLVYITSLTITRGKGIIVLSVASLLILLIGFSRLYLGLHYISDTLAGYLIGAAFLTAGIYVGKYLNRRAVS